jgi:hypothetical protein
MRRSTLNRRIQPQFIQSQRQSNIHTAQYPQDRYLIMRLTELLSEVDILAAACDYGNISHLSAAVVSETHEASDNRTIFCCIEADAFEAKSFTIWATNTSPS